LGTEIKWLDFEIKKTKVIVTAKFSGEGILIDSSPSNASLLLSRQLCTE